MFELSELHKRFESVSEKEHWENLKKLLLSDNKENVVQGMNLLESLDEQVYYDGVCSFLEDDGKGNWRLQEGLESQNELSLKVEIVRLAEENIGHEIKEGFENGCFDDMFVGVCGEIDFGELSESQQQRLLTKVTEMVEVKAGSFVMGSPDGEEDRDDDEVQHEVELTRDYFVMKYQVTQNCQ